MQNPSQKPAQGSGFRLDGRTILIILLVIGVIFILTRANQGSAPAEPTATPIPPTVVQQDPVAAGGVELGELVASTAVDRDSCPTEPTSRFDSDDTIYIATEESFIPAGTTAYVRLYLGNEAVEDTDEITADSDMTTCVFFVFENDEGFEEGDYEAELFINGNSAGSVSFTVR
jgi:hypothetical protein